MVRQKIKENLHLLILGLVTVLIAILFFIQSRWIDNHTYKETYRTTVTIMDKKEYTTTHRLPGKGIRYRRRHHYMIYYEADYKGIKHKGSVDNHYLYNKYAVNDKEKALMTVWYYADNTDKKGQVFWTKAAVSWKY